MTIAVGATVAIVLLFVITVLVIDGAQEDVVAGGVKVGTVDVGGLDRAKARAVVQRELASAVREPVTATYGKQRFVLRPEETSARVDIDATVDAALSSGRAGDPFGRVFGGKVEGGKVTPRIFFSRPAIQDFAAKTAERVDRKARDADIDWHDGKLVRTRAQAGIDVQRPKLVAAIAAALADPSAQRTVEVPARVSERPDRTFEDFADRYPTVIAVDRDAKVLRFYKDLKLAKRYKIAVGKAGLETAAGRYKIAEKEVNPEWRVPNSDWAGDLAGQTIAPDDPRNPLEARWMGFHDGQGIHGTDDVASLGTAASHGCIRMAVKDVKRLYSEVELGTPLFLQ